MKKRALILFLLLLSVTAFSQTLPNGGFENWHSDFLFEQPDSLTTTNVQLFYMGYGSNVFKSTDAIEGQYAAKLQTVVAGTDTIGGFMIFGDPNFNGNGIIGRPYTNRPDTFAFYAKYNIIPGDMAQVVIAFIIHSMCDTLIAFPVTFTGQNNTYTQYKVPISWPPLGCGPDTMMAVFSSSRLDPPRSPGSILYLDKMELIQGTVHYPFPNGNLENWNTVMSPEEATGWQSMNIICAPGDFSAEKSTDAYEGTYSLSLRNVLTVPGDTLGFITNGRLSESYPQGGLKVDMNPEKLTGFYKYTPVGTDTAMGALFSYRYDAGLDSNVVVEQKMFMLPPAASWTPFEFTLDYDSSPAIDTLNITFASGNYFSSPVVGIGSTLLLDALSLHYYHLDIFEPSSRKLTIYPNPAENFIFINNADNLSLSELKIYDLAGRLLKNTAYDASLQNGKIMIVTEKLGNGIYFILSGKGKSQTGGSFLISR